ncbi:MAG: ceramide glucosyltransferase [Pseudolabrys sp.]
MYYVFLLGGAFCAVATAFHFVSILVVSSRFGKRDIGPIDDTAGVSILRPVCGVENFVEETLLSTFQLAYPRYEIVFCAADANDPVIPCVRRLMAEHPCIESRLLIGNSDASANPKLNNLAKGWREAQYNWVLMVDSNVSMPKDHLQRMLSIWRNDTGLVCSPPIGGEPDGAWAELECAFLNTYQARWQCFADTLGFGFAQGKAMLWRRDMLDAAGGIAALGSELAEDAAATKIVRKLGLHVRLVANPFIQPLGYRRAAEVWHRQVRWARLRRSTFKLFFIPEIFVGILPPLAVGTALLTAAGWPVIDAAVPYVLAWYAAELFLAWRGGWQLSVWSLPMWIVRDVVSPALWIAAWTGDDFEWRGNAMNVETRALSCEFVVKHQSP